MASNGNGNCLATKMPKTDPTKSPKCSVFPELLKQFLPLEGVRILGLTQMEINRNHKSQGATKATEATEAKKAIEHQEASGATEAKKPRKPYTTKKPQKPQKPRSHASH